MSKDLFQKIPKSVKGMKDILPVEAVQWQNLEKKLRCWFRRYDFSEIRTPLVEEAALFAGAIGEGTDIVTKEMYSFGDRGGRSLSLRPEATASIARAYIEHSFHKTDPVAKWYYIGPMFRAERPQKGRQRQFHQAGVEYIGENGPYADAETISLLFRLFTDTADGFGFAPDDLILKVNNIGCYNDRKIITDKLRHLLKDRKEALCDDCKERIETNVLRVLDCKNPACRKIVNEFPDLSEWVCEDCNKHFARVKRLLDVSGIKYQIAPHLVRGLDYYTKTVFELISSNLGGQDALAAGGRYDGLLDRFGVSGIGAVGFAVGLERVLLLAWNVAREVTDKSLDCFFISTADILIEETFQLMDKVRNAGINSAINFSSKSVKAQFRQANKSGAKFAVIFGEEEFQDDCVTVKDMSCNEQEKVKLCEVIPYLLKKLIIGKERK